MICIKCKSNIPDDSVFCPNCGDILNNSGKVKTEPINLANNKKAKYCKKCGGEINSSTKKCVKCGKQYFKLPIFRFKLKYLGYLFILLIIVGLIILNIYQYNNNKLIISSYTEKIKEKEHIISVHSQDKANLYTEMDKLRGKAQFMDYAVVIVPNDGTRRYHKYGCEYLDTSHGFWAYNTEAAPSDGYRACPYCIK